MDAAYRRLFESLDRDKDGRVSHWELLAELQKAGIQADDPRIQETLTALQGADGW